jgi:HAD superfamily hydrolase (TIGR01450 family)
LIKFGKRALLLDRIKENRFHNIHTFLFDLDGCIYYGDVLARGASPLIQRLKDAGRKVCFVTNNSRQTSAEVADKLQRMGLQASPSEIITATECTGTYIMDKYGSCKVKAAGSLGLSSALESAGHIILPFESADRADIIVVGRDTEFTYAKLASISREVSRGAQVISANPDLFHPGSDGERVPETGALIAAIQAVTGKNVEFVGKPASYLFLYGMEVCGAKAQECVMVGDNYDTDITGGKNAGMNTVWISNSSEESDAVDIQKFPHADFIIRNIYDLNEWLILS